MKQLTLPLTLPVNDTNGSNSNDTAIYQAPNTHQKSHPPGDNQFYFEIGQFNNCRIFDRQTMTWYDYVNPMLWSRLRDLYE